MSFEERVVSRELVRINLGCGLAAIPGFDNIDNSPSVVLSRFPRIKWMLFKAGLIGEHHYRAQWPPEILWQDASRRLSYADASVDRVYSSHFLEHVPYPKAQRIVRECFRVLKPGGIFRLVVPDLLHYAREYVRRSDSLLSMGSADRAAHDEFLEMIYGAYLTRARSHHHYMYDWPSLASMLGDAGFIRVRRCAYRESADPELAQLDNRPDDSVHVEAIR
jgi:predicted SAM-dependent methyltransferase